MRTELLRFSGVLARDPAIDRWLNQQQGELGPMAREWFERMRACGDEVREVFHDGCANACFGDVPFAYVGVFKAHVNLGFFQGASLRDPEKLLVGAGKCMRHVKLLPGHGIDSASLIALIEAAYSDIKTRLENG